MRFLIALFLIAASMGIDAKTYARNITLEDYLEWETASDPQISPNGETVLYSRRSVDKVQDKIASEIWAIETKSGLQYRLLEQGSIVRWSPNGERIAFLGDGGQIFVRHMGIKGALSRITTNVRDIQRLEWAPNGKFLIFRAKVLSTAAWKIDMPKRPQGAIWNAEPTVIDKLHYRRDRYGPLNGYQHLFVVPADGGTPRQITSGDWNVGTQFSAVDFSNRFSITPDSKAVVFAGVANSNELMEFRSDINIVDLQTRSLKQLKKSNAVWNTPRVSPDGSKVAYIGGVAEGVNYPSTDLRMVNIDGNDDRLILSDLPARVSTMFWGADSKGIYYSVHHAGKTDVFYTSLSGHVRQVTSGDHRFYMSSISQTGLAAGIYEDAKTTANVTIARLKNGHLDQLTDLNEDIFHDVQLSDVEEFDYASTDGFQIQGWLMKPPDFSSDKKYPLILSIHGGPEGMYGFDFDLRFQDYAAEGYLVLYVNPRGSTGYGRDFMHAIANAFPGKGDYEDLMAGVDHIIARDIVDTNKMYVSGCSGGGALTAWVVTQTDRFAAAASLCTIVNYLSFVGQTDVVYWGATRYFKPYWEDSTSWLEHSPIMHVGNVETPTLLMTGDNDLRTPIAQAEEFFAALKLRNVDTKLISMAGEYHGVWSIPSNFIRAQLYQKKWFSEHVKSESEQQIGQGE